MRATHLAIIATAMLTGAIASAAAAATCGDRPVSARGEASRLEVLAKAKARGNWRAKVRTLPGLGAAFADWYKAEGADYTCSEGEDGYVCTAFALPCRE
jgi:hypothetical protein